MVSWTRRVLAAGVSALLAPLVAGLPGPAYADSVPPVPQELLTTHTDLPLTAVSDAVYVAGTDRVFVAGASKAGSPVPLGADAVVAVMKPDGTALSTVPLTGATSLSVEPDGSHVWAAVPMSSEIVSIDTATYAVTTYSTGAGSCPVRLAAGYGTVWYVDSGSAQCSVSFGTSVHSLDMDTGAVGPALPGVPAAQLPVADLRVGAVPNHHEMVLWGHDQESQPRAIVADTDTAGVVTSAAVDLGTFSVTSDGTSVVDADGGRYSLPDLAPAGTLGLPRGRYVFDDHVAVAAGSNVAKVYDLGSSTQVDTIDVDPLDVPYAAPQIGDHLLAGGTLDLLAVKDDHLRLYTDPAPDDPAPMLTTDTLSPVVTHPTDVTGSLLDGSTPVAGATVTLRDESLDVVGTGTTDAQGHWTINHTWDTAGFHDLYVTTDSQGARKASFDAPGVTVQRLPSVIDANVPSSVAVGDTADVTGTALVDGSPAGAKVVTWSARCTDGDAVPGQSGQVTTAADGTFAFGVAPGRCATMSLSLSSLGNDMVQNASYGPVDVTVPWHRYAVTANGPTTVTVDDPYDVTLTATRDGQPAAGVPLDVSVAAWTGGPRDLSGTTAADGTLTVHVETALASTYDLVASTPGTSDTLSGQTELRTEATSLPQSATLLVEPSSVEVGRTVTLSGSLSRDDGHVGGVELVVTASDSAGVQRTHAVTTADDGSFTVADVPLAVGTTAYAFQQTTDQRYASLTASAYVSVQPIQPRISVTLQPPWGTTRGLATYAAHTHATVQADVRPRADAMCVRFQAQRRTEASWRTIRLTACHRTSDGRASWRFGGRIATPGLYRVRASSRADSTHVAGRSTWHRLRFVRP